MKNALPSIYLKLFVSTTLSILVSLLATSTILYVNFVDIALKQAYANDMDTLMQTAKGVGALTNMAVTLSNQIYNDPSVSPLMYYAEPGPESLRVADAQLTNYRLSLPFIDSVYVYNGKQRTFYVNSAINRNEVREAIQKKASFDDGLVATLIDTARDYPPYRPIPRRYESARPSGSVKHYYTFLMYDAYGKGEIDHAVVINFSEEWISDFMSDNSPLKEAETFAIDGDGSVVSNAKSFPMLSDLSGEAWVRSALASDGASSREATVMGRKFLVSHTAADQNGWRYAKLTPIDSVTSAIDRMQYVTVIVGLGLLAVGLVASWFLTKRLYVPIDSLMTTLRKLSLEEKKNVGLLRQAFFRDILLGRCAYDGQTIELKLEELDASFNASGFFLLILARIDGYLAFGQDYTAVDQSLAKNAIMDACAAAFDGIANKAILDLGANGIVVVLNSLDAAADLAPDAIEGRIVRLRGTIAETVRLSVSFTVSGLEAGIDRLADMYDETYEASLYRLYRGRGSVIHAREIRDLPSGPYEYPAATERRLVSALLSGKLSEAKELLDDIVGSANDRPINVFSMMLSRLAFAVDEAAGSVRKANGVDLDVGKRISVIGIASEETVLEITARFHAAFEDMCAIVLDRKSNRVGQVVERIDRMIETGYMRQDLYIDSIAASLDKSPTYISHVYKQHTGTTILDKIVDVRMSRAKELLRSSGLSATEISERAGFSSGSYFFKVFRKITGMTPNEFRERGESDA